MNIRVGLERMSAVWWGFWGLLLGIWAVLLLVTNREEGALALGAIAALLPVYLLHKLTCWVIAGFFSAKP